MRRFLAVAIFLSLIQATVFAQSSNERRVWGYAFGGAGASAGDFSSGFFQFGAGGEALVNKGMGVGAEIAYLAPFRSGGNGIGLFSGNTSYHFSRSSKLVPFVTGGYSAGFRSGVVHGGNFGGGVHYWMNDHLGLRLEFRDHIFSSDSPHLFQFRVGLSFR
jgi:outer membrane protein with beta-barrel domain